MKKALKVFSVALAAMLLLFNVANAQRTYDTLSVRNFRYTTLQNTGAPIVLTDSLTSDSAAVLSDIREGCLAVGYKIVITSGPNAYAVDVREPNYYYDGYLYILDSNFNEVNYNDDYTINGVSGSTCAGMCGAGTYYIIVTKFNNVWPTRTPLFNLTVDVQTLTCAFKGINDLSELPFRPVADTAELVEMTDSVIVNDTVFFVNDIYAVSGGDVYLQSDEVTGGIYPLAGYTFTLDSSRQFHLDVFDTIDTIGYLETFLLDDQYRLVSDLESGAMNLEAGTYNLVLLPYRNWTQKLPVRYSLAFKFMNVFTPRNMTYTTINTLPYTDTVSCTPSSRLFSIDHNSGYTETALPTGAYKLHMNADTLYRFSSVDIDGASDYHSITVFDSNFKIVQATWSAYDMNLDFIPTKSDDYYIVVLTEGVDDTSLFAFSAYKSAVPAFYVDAVNGSDENDGTTPSTAFASFDKVQDSTGVVYLMSDIDIYKTMDISGVINLRGYQNRAYILNCQGNPINVYSQQFMIGSENALDTLVFVDSRIYDEYGAILDVYGDVEFTSTTPSYGNCLYSIGFLNVHGTRFHDIYLADYSLIRTYATSCDIEGISADNCVSDYCLMYVSFMNDKCVIDSCSFTNCNAESILYLYTDVELSVKSPVFEISNVSIVEDTMDYAVRNTGGCVVNMTNVDIERSKVFGPAILNESASQFNMYSGNISHNVMDGGSAIGNHEYGKFTMYGGAIEDNVCMGMMPVVNKDGGVMELRGGRMNDNIAINVSEMPEMPGVTMRNYGGILSFWESKLTIRDSFSINSDAFIMTDTAVTIGSALTADECGTLVPMGIDPTVYLKSASFYTLRYYEGRQMLDGDESLVRSQYSKFDLAQYDTITWYIDNHGRLTSTPVGLNTAEQATVKVYPNPTSDYVNIDANTVVAEGIILDMQGRVIAQQPMVSGSTRINMQALANGVYFIQLLNDQHEVLATKKIIKK